MTYFELHNSRKRIRTMLKTTLHDSSFSTGVLKKPCSPPLDRLLQLITAPMASLARKKKSCHLAPRSQRLRPHTIYEDTHQTRFCEHEPRDTKLPYLCHLSPSEDVSCCTCTTRHAVRTNRILHPNTFPCLTSRSRGRRGCHRWSGRFRCHWCLRTHRFRERFWWWRGRCHHPARVRALQRGRRFLRRLLRRGRLLRTSGRGGFCLVSVWRLF